MSGNATFELSRLRENWRQEDHKLSMCIDEIRHWMDEVNQLGIPHFGEAASRMEPLRETMVQHFECEDGILAELSKLYELPSPEMSALEKQTMRSHGILLSRLDDLHRRLKEIDPPFLSWTAAMDEVDLLFEAMEEHERTEHDRVAMLVPGS